MFKIKNTDKERIYYLNEMDVFFHIKYFEENVESFINNDHRNLVLDMNDLESIDSTFLSVVVKFRTELYARGRTLHVTNYNDQILKYFQLLNLEGHLLK
jgi:anti-anti-sigma factor